MVSGLFSARTVVHLSTAPATASFEHAVAVCTEAAALNTSTTALIARRVCIISSLIFDDIPISARSPFSSGRAGGCNQTMRLLLRARRERPRGCAADEPDDVAALRSITAPAPRDEA